MSDENTGLALICEYTLRPTYSFSIQLLQSGHVESRYRLVKTLETEFAYRFSYYQFFDEAEHLLRHKYLARFGFAA